MPDCKCWSWAGPTGSVHPSAGLICNYAVSGRLPSNILVAVDKFEHTGACGKISVQASVQASGHRNRADRLCLAGSDLDQSYPARGQQAWKLREEHAISIEPLRPGKQRA